MTQEAIDRLEILRGMNYMTQDELEELRQLGMQQYNENRTDRR